jgi:hypothetical protein
MAGWALEPENRSVSHWTSLPMLTTLCGKTLRFLLPRKGSKADYNAHRRCLECRAALMVKMEGES